MCSRTSSNSRLIWICCHLRSVLVNTNLFFISIFTQQQYEDGEEEYGPDSEAVHEEQGEWNAGEGGDEENMDLSAMEEKDDVSAYALWLTCA